jgi:hypothetical protein
MENNNSEKRKRLYGTLSQNYETTLPNSTMRLSDTPVSDFLSFGMNHNYCPLIFQSKITKPKNYNKIPPLAI